MLEDSYENYTEYPTIASDASWDDILEKMEENQERHKQEYARWTHCILGWKAQHEIEENQKKQENPENVKEWIQKDVNYFTTQTTGGETPLSQIVLDNPLLKEGVQEVIDLMSEKLDYTL